MAERDIARANGAILDPDRERLTDMAYEEIVDKATAFAKSIGVDEERMAIICAEARDEVADVVRKEGTYSAAFYWAMRDLDSAREERALAEGYMQAIRHVAALATGDDTKERIKPYDDISDMEIKDLRRDAVVLAFVNYAAKSRKYNMMEHMQKGCYLLSLLGVDLGFEFYPRYNHPYSDDFAGELGYLRSRGYAQFKAHDAGPIWSVTDKAADVTSRYSKTLKRLDARLRFAAREFSAMPGGEMERVSLALWLLDEQRRTGEPASGDSIAAWIRKIKPYVNMEQSLLAEHAASRMLYKARVMGFVVGYGL